MQGQARSKLRRLVQHSSNMGKGGEGNPEGATEASGADLEPVSSGAEGRQGSGMGRPEDGPGRDGTRASVTHHSQAGLRSTALLPAAGGSTAEGKGPASSAGWQQPLLTGDRGPAVAAAAGEGAAGRNLSLAAAVLEGARCWSGFAIQGRMALSRRSYSSVW